MLRVCRDFDLHHAPNGFFIDIGSLSMRKEMLDEMVTKEAVGKVASLIGPREFKSVGPELFYSRHDRLQGPLSRILGEILGAVFGSDAVLWTNAPKPRRFRLDPPSHELRLVHVNYKGRYLIFSNYWPFDASPGGLMVYMDNEKAGLSEHEARRVIDAALDEVNAYLNHIDVFAITEKWNAVYKARRSAWIDSMFKKHLNPDDKPERETVEHSR